MTISPLKNHAFRLRFQEQGRNLVLNPQRERY
jgi:hypothetical protein